MNKDLFAPQRASSGAFTVALVLAVLLPAALQAQSVKKKNPASKVFVSDVSGEAQIDTGDNIQDLSKRSVYNAEGTIIETKKAETDADKGKIYSTAVYSNGTGAYFDHDTRVEMKKFVQEPFTPNRADMEVEPSISQTQAFVAHGTVGLCTSKPVAGSTTNYSTPLGAVNIRGRKVVIEANDNETSISMLEGDSTVHGGTSDLGGGHTLHAGERATIRKGAAGQPNIVSVSRIPPAEMNKLDDKVAMACMAKKTVYFEVKEHTVNAGPEKAADNKDAKDTKVAKTDDDTKDGGGVDTATDGSNGSITAFDGPVANSNNRSGGSSNTTVVSEIVAVPVTSPTLPVQYTVSPSTIISPKPRSGG